MTRRSTLLRLLLVMLLGAIGWAGATSTAHAGGPTSVLMTNPESGRASALHIANADYGRLSAAVGQSTGEAEPPTGLSPGGEEVRLTWLIHDVQVWRIDRVHLTRQDGIWIETAEDLTGDRNVFDQLSRWHRPQHDKALLALLSQAGLLSADSADSSPPNPDGSSPVTAASSAPARPVAPIVVAAVGGLVVGAVGSLLLRRRPTVDRPGVTLTG